MSSYLIIDGYNLINKLPSLIDAKDKSIEHARDKLFDLVQAYCDYSGVEGIIVFDGQGPERTIEEKNPTIIFSRSGESADTVIESIIYNSTDKENTRVVSDDVALINMVTGMGVFTISTSAFGKDLESTIKNMRDRLNE